MGNNEVIMLETSMSYFDQFPKSIRDAINEHGVLIDYATMISVYNKYEKGTISERQILEGIRFWAKTQVVKKGQV